MIHAFQYRLRRWLMASLAAAALFSPIAAANTESPAISSATGSGERYLTTVNQKTEGELSPEDARQASVLSSRILTHVNNASDFLADEKPDQARTELELAQSLADIVRELLPVTTVTTVVEDAEGNEVYRYQDQIQDDRIPIFEGLITVEVVEPIVDAKQEQAALQGVQLEDANLIRTSTLMDLSYVEQKVRQALRNLEEPNDALADLLLAQAYGVDFVTREEDHPLVEAQAALRLAERQVREEKFEGASANLELARLHLETYRTLIDEAEGSRVRELEEEINALESDLSQPDAAGKIRNFWNRVTGWFVQEPGQAAHTADSADDAGEDR